MPPEKYGRLAVNVVLPCESIDLYKFPPEIRRCIYDQIFRGRTFVSNRAKYSDMTTPLPVCRSDSENFLMSEDSRCMQILLASEAVRSEALKSFYVEGHFVLEVDNWNLSKFQTNWDVH